MAHCLQDAFVSISVAMAVFARLKWHDPPISSMFADCNLASATCADDVSCILKWCASAEFCENLLQSAGARFGGPIAILRNWTFCLFYVMAELWGSVVVSLLFWGFANQVTKSCLQHAYMSFVRQAVLNCRSERDGC